MTVEMVTKAKYGLEGRTFARRKEVLSVKGRFCRHEGGVRWHAGVRISRQKTVRSFVGLRILRGGKRSGGGATAELEKIEENEYK